MKKKQSFFEKLCSGYEPQPTVKDHLFMEKHGICNTECSDVMKSMGLCACHNIEWQRLNDGRSASLSPVKKEKNPEEVNQLKN